ncbi:NAD-dependent epimerase/dehydratase family protein [Nonomuraea sp. PA05]|uniref:NAD-dependent epimerase/dehydratase family protein n=1 Tax=Nonomuraea sp. PA05 TaxID=2604466 RepID=UPI001651FD6E|nr:NAD-dependent epimerase/dehydratase family protein [Nonomuraea sp. PA05]
MILVTGGTGHLGANLVRRLLADQAAVRVLVRPGSRGEALDGLPVERVEGDLRDEDALARAVSGCERVYHCAARISTRAGRERELFDCNVAGTGNLLAAARRADVRRVVVTGSLSAVGHEPGRPSDETMPFYPFGQVLPYSHTKALVEHECLKAVVAGLDVVIAVSTAIVGPHDHGPSRLGRTLLDFARGRLRAYVPGGFEFVNAADLARGHLLAMERGTTGHRYIFSTQFLTVEQLLGLCASALGRSVLPVRVPGPLMSAAAAVTDPLVRRLRPGAPQRFTPAAVRFLRSQRRADTGKARRELGYRPTSIAEAVAEAYACFRRRGLLR